MLEFEQAKLLPKSLHFHCRKLCTLIAEFFVLVLPKTLYFTLPFTAPIGKTPVLKVEAKKLKLNMLSAISNKGKLRFTITKESVNADILIDFMKRLIKDTGRKVLLILDNLRVHHAKKVAAWLEEHQQEIELFYLPPYSPEYNPDEYLNSDLKREMSKKPIPKSEKELSANARSVLKRIQMNPKKVISFFGSKFTKYAIA